MIGGAIAGLIVALVLWHLPKPEPKPDQTNWKRVGVTSAALLIGGSALLVLLVSMTK